MSGLWNSFMNAVEGAPSIGNGPRKYHQMTANKDPYYGNAGQAATRKEVGQLHRANDQAARALGNTQKPKKSGAATLLGGGG